MEETLRRGHLMVCFDEAHYYWPQLNMPRALSARINWIMIALVNRGVTAALITTPQFIRSQKVVEQRTHWTSEQFVGRIGHYQKLPDSLGESDLRAVSKALLPAGDARSIEYLVNYANGSAKFLTGRESLACRANYLAHKTGRNVATCADVRRAIQESVIPSDSALAKALEEAPTRRRRGVSAPLQTTFKGAAEDTLPPRDGHRLSGRGHDLFSQENRLADLDPVAG